MPMWMLLACLGKGTLRPGGMVLTQQLLDMLVDTVLIGIQQEDVCAKTMELNNTLSYST